MLINAKLHNFINFINILCVENFIFSKQHRIKAKLNSYKLEI